LWRQLIFRSLRFYARSHLGSLLGVTVAGTVLVGALAVGDCARESLRGMALARLGRIRFALPGKDRLFRGALAEDLRPAISNGLAAAALQLPCLAANQDGSARANHAQILGVDDHFWAFAQSPPALPRDWSDGVLLNQPLARQLGVKIGDTILLRAQKPSLLSLEAPISPQQDLSAGFRLPVKGIVSDDELGRFSLQANQIPPLNAFVPLHFLQGKVGLPGKANLLLTGGAEATVLQCNQRIEVCLAGPVPDEPSMMDISKQGTIQVPFIANAIQAAGRSPQELEEVIRSNLIQTIDANVKVSVTPLERHFYFSPNTNQSEAEGNLTQILRVHWTLADAQCELRQTPGGLELRSERVFLDPPVAQAAAALAPLPHPELILTYFVNELRDGTNTTPYSMVTAAGGPLVPADMGDDEILINQWLADDLRAKPGDPLELTYLIPGTTNRMEEKKDRFRVRAVLPMSGPTEDRTLLPDFPGIAKAESTANWDAGFPIDLGKIRPKDEQYWREFRGTPKAFVTLAAGQRMWANRFGDLTAMRFPGGPAASEVERQLLSKLNPADAGLAFLPVREQALAAAATGQAQEFGGLFLSFSFFLIAAALILLALLFQFGIEKRSKEIGILLAVGWRPALVRRWLLGEGGAVALAGGLLGVAGAALYARGILWGLATLWSAAVGHSALRFHVTFGTLAGGGAATVLVGLGVMWLAARSQTRRTARDLLEQGNEMEARISMTRRGRSWAAWVAAAAFLGALALAAGAMGQRNNSAVAAFFGGGALLLIAGIAAASVWFRSLGGAVASKPLSLFSLAVRGCARRRNRSLATVALLASGTFLIIAVEANKLDARQAGAARSSGTGGFALIGESAFPVTQDLNTKSGRDFFNLDQKSLADVRFLALRVRDGDDASCLNLNRAQTPRLLGVRPELLDDRHAFTFTELEDKALAQHPWSALRPGVNSNPEEIPAIGDEASITWALGKKIGDTVDYTDEHGQPFKLRIVGAVANSILQGSLLIDEAQFVKRFPGESGYRVFLVDAPSKDAPVVAATLTRALQDRGLELTPAADRLNAYNAVQNTYLNTFQMLGALGLLLGSAGLGAVALRNVLERRGELALLLAVGFTPRALRWMVICEHGALQCLGLLLGVLAAGLAVLPVLLSPGAQISSGKLALTLGLVLAGGCLWTWAAARLALRGQLLDALRNE
jgi:ABC-type antimicrobial peptide transport system permease subunit